MILDNKLVMNDHVDNMWKKANTKVGIRLWDQLPPSLQKEETKIKFQNELNRFKWQ